MKKTKFKKDLSNRIKEIGSGSTIRGITLISLVITIIVLLILAGITLTFVLGENGLIAKSKRAKEETIQSQAIEDIQLKITEAYAEGLGDFSWENFLKILRDAPDTYLVKTTSSQTSSLSSDNGGINDINGLDNHIGSVYVTNLTNYKYEVEIGSDFKIKNQVTTASSGSNNGSISSGGETSQLISNVNFQLIKSYGRKLEIKINATVSQATDLYECIVLVNNEAKQSCKDISQNVFITNLEKNTAYSIKIMAIDKNGNVKYSTAQSIQTANKSLVDNNTILFLDSDEGEDIGIYHETISGTMNISTEVYKYGSSSFAFDGTTANALQISPNNFNFGTNDFTIDLWVKTATSGANRGLITLYPDAYTTGNWALKLCHSGGRVAEMTIKDSSTWNNQMGTTDLTDNNWHHVAFVRNGTNIYLFVDGIAEKTATVSGNYTIGNLSANIYIGNCVGTSNNCLNGYLSRIRISNIARWTSNFSTSEDDLY